MPCRGDLMNKILFSEKKIEKSNQKYHQKWIPASLAKSDFFGSSPHVGDHNGKNPREVEENQYASENPPTYYTTCVSSIDFGQETLEIPVVQKNNFFVRKRFSPEKIKKCSINFWNIFLIFPVGSGPF